jgi:hypothetical protein
VKYVLSLRLKASARSGVEYGTGTPMLYDVEGLPDGQKISIRNVRAHLREASWQIGGQVVGQPTRWTGDFKSAEEALVQLQLELDASEVAPAVQIEKVAHSVGWTRVPIMGIQNPKTAAVILTRGPMVVRVRLHDCAWAFYTEFADGKTPDRWGKDYPSLVAFLSSHDVRQAKA